MIGSAMVVDALNNGCGFIPSETMFDIVTQQIPPADQVLRNFADVGDVVGIFGKSKTRKSFFCLQLAACLATGTPFLGIEVPRSFVVVVYQLEVKRDHYARRVKMIGQALFGQSPEFVDGANNLTIKHCRGKALTIEEIKAEVAHLQPDVIVIDPIYPLYEAENEASDTKKLQAAISEIAELGTTVFYVHHDKKGKSGDMDLVDRGSGSSILGRAYDAAFYIDPHASREDAQVISSITRNYPSDDPFPVVWDKGIYTVAPPEVTAEVETTSSANRKRSKGGKVDDLARQAIAVLPRQEMLKSLAVSTVADQLGIGQKKAMDVVNRLFDDDFGDGFVEIRRNHNKAYVAPKTGYIAEEETLDDLLD